MTGSCRSPLRVLVAGAGGALGVEIVRLLLCKGVNVIAAMRTRRPRYEILLKELGADIRELDLVNLEAVRKCLSDVDGAIFTPILSVSAASAKILRQDQAAVFFSSNNVVIDPQAAVYAKLLAAEKTVRADAPQAVILRPTMIYGYPGDGNLSKLMAAMKRWPLVPMPGRGDALQQPLFYKDLARVAVDILFDGERQGSVCAVAGPDVVPQHRLYEMAAEASGVRPRTFGAPISFAAALLRAVERTGVKLPVTAAQLYRAGIDKTPRGENVIMTGTPLETGLAALSDALDAAAGGA